MTDSEIRVGSLCTGVGGLDAAVPGRLAWYAETNEAAASVMEADHPDVKNLGDITQIQAVRGEIDLLTSGDPCQSMSSAGRQLASLDDRFLWPEVRRIYRDALPAQIFLENVQNLRSARLLPGADDWRGEKGSVLKLRLDNLREDGYAVRWCILGACSVGAPHHRHRWFARATYVGVGLAPEAVQVATKCGAPRNGPRQLLPSLTTADGTSPKREGGMNLRTAVQLLPTPRATDIGTEGRRSSEGWRPQLGQVIHELLPTPRATDGTNGGPNQRGSSGDLAMGSAVQPEHWGKFADAIALWEQITGTPAPEPTELAPRGGRRLNPALSEWMMGQPAGRLTGRLARNGALKAAGNGVVTLQARTAWDLLG